MRLVVDASVLVAELLRARGRALIAHPDLDLVLAAETLSETEHELRKRVAQLERLGRIGPEVAQQFVADALATLAAGVSLIPQESHTSHLEEARRRVPRDINDVPIAALALALNCGIWTLDNDFFGCGLPVWTTETLLLHLGIEEQP